MKYPFLMTFLAVVTACGPKTPPQKPLSTVLQEEHIEVPSAGPGTRPMEVVTEAIPVAENEFEGLGVGLGTDGRFTLGGTHPEIVIYMYSDVQCPYCRRAFQMLLGWLRRHPERLQLVHVHFPLAFHQHAMTFARVATCAGEQGRFWQVLAELYQAPYQKFDPSRLARSHHLSESVLNACLKGSAVQQHIARDIAEGKRLGVSGTPTFVVDGAVLNSVSLEGLLQAKLKN